MIKNIGANIKFGECLNYLLNALDISINRLSKAINVDSSLVNRWIHEKRLPSYNTTYIERISDYLSKNIHNTFQIKQINDLLIKFGDKVEKKEDIKVKIKMALSESQGYSIELRSEGKEYKNLKKKELLYTENNMIQNLKSEECINSKEYVNSNSAYIELSSEDRIIRESKNILSEVILLLETAANKKCNNNRTIYLSFNNDFNFGKNQFPYLEKIKNILLKAINNGWSVIFLLRLNSNLKRTIKIIDFAKPLIKAGSFNPFYIEKYDIFNLGKESIIIPGIGAMSCYSTSPYSDINFAFILKNKVAIDILQQNFSSVIKTLAHPLINYFAKSDFKDYSSCLLRIENSIGKRFILEYGFNSVTIPDYLYKNFLKKINFSEKCIEDEMIYYKKRQNAFLLNIQNFDYKDMYSIDSINRLINHQQLFIFCSRGVNLINVEIHEIIDIIQNIIYLLKKFENYNIAFIDNYQMRNFKEDYCIIVKERQGILFETFNSTMSTTEINLSIEEPMFVKAFVEHFKDIWEHIAPVNKDKNEIIAWLQSNVEVLRKVKS